MTWMRFVSIVLASGLRRRVGGPAEPRADGAKVDPGEVEAPGETARRGRDRLAARGVEVVAEGRIAPELGLGARVGDVAPGGGVARVVAVAGRFEPDAERTVGNER